jgi:hypothetical protein
LNLWNLFNRFYGNIGMNMRKAAYPSGGMGSSNPCRWRGKRLHHGGGVCLLFLLFVPSRLVVVTRRM